MPKGKTPTHHMQGIQRLRTAARFPQGPRMFRQNPTVLGGPGKAPPGFVVGQTSASEWIVYWSLSKIYDNPKDPRQGPFYGGFPDWGYQKSALGAYRRAPGSAVVDFVVYNGPETVGIRLQTLRFHYVTDAVKQAFDALQRALLERGMRVFDMNEQDVLGDPTGAKAIVACKNAINLVEPLNPIFGGVDPRRR